MEELKLRDVLAVVDQYPPLIRYDGRWTALPGCELAETQQAGSIRSLQPSSGELPPVGAAGA